MRRLLSLFALCFTFAPLVWCQHRPVALYENSPSTYPWRIPAIVQHTGGDVLAFAGLLKCGTDVGFGRCDIFVRISSDQGATWSEPTPVVYGTGTEDFRTDGRIYNDFTYGFGDVAVVCDRESGTILALCAAGGVAWPFSERTDGLKRALRCAVFTGNKDVAGHWTWFPPRDITTEVYNLLPAAVDKAFVGSGKLFQSQRIKAGSHYRVYAPLCTNLGNCVLYSDDLGNSWKALGNKDGSAEVAVPDGNEPKIIELPNGDVLISSRKASGRYFNIFKYEDCKAATGSWQTVSDSATEPGGLRWGDNPCNGEIILLNAINAQTSQPVNLLLQSLPIGPGRSHVAIAYKELSAFSTPQQIGADWPEENLYLLTDDTSCYSTFCLQHNGRLGVLYEKTYTNNCRIGDGYTIIYEALSLEEITKGRYRLAQ